ncbi:MAG: Na+/H+ antiporter subunit D [Planctomycetaceae bacterium]|nr:Na+/H+ antiporter subunit D [Planctomycetaceae bacterium]
MTHVLLVLPLLIPLTTAAVSLLAWRGIALQRVLAVAGAAALLCAGVALLAYVWKNGICTTQAGAWPVPFGITLVADLFSALMVVLAGVVGLAVVVFSLGSIDRGRDAFGYYPLVHSLLLGVCGAFLTGDLFNLYVWFEVMLMSSFVLLALGGERPQLHGGIKYVTLNLVSSAVFLAAVAMLYGLTGTLNMADLARKLAGIQQPALVSAVGMLFLIAFGIKAAVFPLFFWLPASYHTPPGAVSALFAGLLTKVGVYALIRVFTLIFVGEMSFTHLLILVLSGLTMVTGVLGAMAQQEFRRVLSFHIISQIGYMTMGLGLAGLAESPAMASLALAGSIFYIAHHIIVKTNLFLVSSVARRLCGTFELKQQGGLYQAYPFLAVLFLVPAMSLAGLPPLSGFFAKLSLVQAGLGAGQYAIVATALLVSLLTMFSMTKIWAEAFWKALPEPSAPEASPQRLSTKPWLTLVLPIGALATLTIAIGLGAEAVFTLAMRAAQQLIHREEYIQAVLGGPT